MANRYYTDEHDWVEFSGTVAYIGVSGFKLTGIEKIKSVEFIVDSAYVENNELLGYLHADDYKIPFNMPFDGKILEHNEKYINAAEKFIEVDGDSMWLIKVAPRAPYSREGLTMTEQYLQKISSGLKYE